MKIFVVAFLGIFGLIFDVHAAVKLEKVDPVSPSEIRLIFDQVLEQKNISSEVVNEIFQITVQNAIVYPAKIQTLKEGEVSKIFAYQFTPQVVRIRLTLKMLDESIRNRIQMDLKGREVVFQIRDLPSVTDLATKVGVQSEPVKTVAPAQPSLAQGVADGDVPRIPKEVKSRSYPSVWGAFGKLAAVLFVFCLAAWGITRPRIREKLNRIGKGNLHAQKLIQVQATHWIDQKNRLLWVKAGSKNLLIGVTPSQMQLISELNEGFDDEDSFSAALQEQQDSSLNGVRSRIRSRLEGLKPL